MRLLLCTDLDRTLLPNGKAPESETARDKFSKLAARESVVLAYVSGRHKEIIQEAIEQYRIPVPDFVIADVGTTIYKIKDDVWVHDKHWDEEIATDWAGNTTAQLHELLFEFSELELQEAAKQGDYKLSYYVGLPVNHDLLVKNIKDKLHLAGVHASIIWSIDDLHSVGLLDILPASASKRHAIEYLMREYGFSTTETVFAGDSGNDIAVMVSPLQSVLVANASEEVKRIALQEALKKNNEKSLYIATGNFMGMNGNYAAGILEGVVHYIPEMKDWIGESDE